MYRNSQQTQCHIVLFIYYYKINSEKYRELKLKNDIMGCHFRQY